MLGTKKISDSGIEWYDWEKGKIMLNESGKENFLKYIVDNSFRSIDGRFVVTLDGKRMYAGLILLRYSAMAIAYPVLSYGELGANYAEDFKKTPVIWITPYLVKPQKENFEEETVKNPEIFDYLKEKKQLR